MPTPFLRGEAELRGEGRNGLEPGHSKTMMAAFIVAIRGTVWQAVLLGLSAAISHSLIIWVLAAAALHFGSQRDAERVEPWLQAGSAVCILALAGWMYFRTRRELREAAGHDHRDDRHHDHAHAHSELFILETGHGKVELSVFEDGVQHAQKRFRGFGEVMRRAPYVSCVLLVLLAFYMAWQGWHRVDALSTKPIEFHCAQPAF